MLKYIENTLSYTGDIINSNETILTLSTDLQGSVDVFGELSFENGSSLVIRFLAYGNNIFKAKLNLDNQIKQYLPTSTFKLLIFDTGNYKQSNYIKLNFDLEKITFATNKSNADEIKGLYLKIVELESKLKHIVNGHILESISINNKDYIKAGMILQALDDNGNFIATYPFADIVKEVNGQKAVNSSIILDASMIQYNQNKDIFTAISDVIKALQAINITVKSQSEAIKQLQDNINDVKIKLEKHLNDGIV